MTKISNSALKIKGGVREGGTCEVLRPCHPPKFETCTIFEHNLYIGDVKVMYQSIPSLTTPPPRQTPGQFV